MVREELGLLNVHGGPVPAKLNMTKDPLPHKGRCMSQAGCTRPRNSLTNRKGNRPRIAGNRLQISTLPRHSVRLQKRRWRAHQLRARDQQQSQLRRHQLSTMFAKRLNCLCACRQHRRVWNACSPPTRQCHLETFDRTRRRRHKKLHATCQHTNENTQSHDGLLQ